MNLNVRLAVLFILLGCMTCKLSAQDLHKRIDSYLVKQMSANGIPGLSCAVVRDGKVVYSVAHGVRELGKDEMLTPNNVFHFASVSKTFVATAVVQLIEKGKLKLDDSLTTYLPYFRLSGEWYKDITIHQILNHTSGLPKVKNLEWTNPQFDKGAAERYVRSLFKEKLLHPPGTHYFYTDMGVDILGDLIAKVSGMPFEEYVRKNIFEPLRMNHSSFVYPEIDTVFRTIGHVGEPAHPSSVYPYNRSHAPSSTLNSSVVDMSRWMLANLNHGELDGQRILKADSYRLLWSSSTELDIQSDFNQFQREHLTQFTTVTHGLSWYLGEIEGHRIVFHPGRDTGFGSFILLIPDEQIGVVIASNWDQTDTPALAGDLARLILESDNQ